MTPRLQINYHPRVSPGELQQVIFNEVSETYKGKNKIR